MIQESMHTPGKGGNVDSTLPLCALVENVQWKKKPLMWRAAIQYEECVEMPLPSAGLPDKMWAEGKGCWDSDSSGTGEIALQSVWEPLLRPSTFSSKRLKLVQVLTSYVFFVCFLFGGMGVVVEVCLLLCNDSTCHNGDKTPWENL